MKKFLTDLIDNLTAALERHGSRNIAKPDFMDSPHIALCIGHSRKIAGHPEGGAVSHDGKSNEWNYNLPLAIIIRQQLKASGIRAEIISEYEGFSYGQAQRWLAGRLRALGVLAAVELHFNAASESANGHEWLYWHSSAKGKLLAEKIDQAMRSKVGQLKARGVKAKDASARGADFLSGTHCPAVIAEPFFGSNPMDWAVANARRTEIASAISEGILSYLESV